MPVCKVSPAGASDGASSLLIGSDPAEAIGLVDGRSRSENFLMIMMYPAVPVHCQHTLPLIADAVSSFNFIDYSNCQNFSTDSTDPLEFLYDFL
jgi:hypothetical protein